VITLTIDELLLWLNDRLGKSVHVAVELERGDLTVSILEAEGDLQHWSERADSRSLSVPRDDLTGRYAVGDASFDLTNLGHLDAVLQGDELAIALSDDVTLSIVEQEELPE
jgi:hypothetical protein